MSVRILLLCLLPSGLAAQPTIDSLLSSFNNRFNPTAAYEHVKFFTQYWRVAGGKGFDASVDHIESALNASGLRQADPTATANQSVGSYCILRDSLSHPVWNPENASLTVVSPVETTLERYSLTPVMLCQNSFPIDTTAELVYVGAGDSEGDYATIDVSGKVVFGDAGVNAMVHTTAPRGALGVISSKVRTYNRPEMFSDLICEEGISYDAARHTFGLKLSSRNRAFLKSLLARHHVRIHISITTSFTQGELHTLAAEFTGTLRSDQRVVFVAHIDHYKPGANDNASGSATMAEMVSTLASLIKEKKIAPPLRTLTFLWVDEFNGTRSWMKAHSSEVHNILAVFNLDMTGEDVSKTGGQFWMERTPDPSSIWLRPPDKQTEWGAATLTEDRLLPAWLNDFFFSILEKQAARAVWVVGQHPFEGGSDNEPFLQAGIPAVTGWHFTDYFYHSSMDDTDKVSPEEMKNVGTATLTAGYSIASPDKAMFGYLLSILREASARRLENEAKNSKAALDSIGPSQHQFFLQRQKEREIIDAWANWYDKALLAAERFPILLSPEEKEAIDRERETLRLQRTTAGGKCGVD